MKSIIFFLTSSLTLALLLSACTPEAIGPAPDPGIAELSAQEIQDLQFLREEEKLAHDVYDYAYDQYGVMIFDNISNSEWQHTSKVLGLIQQYELEDPVGNNPPGMFTNADLQELYEKLINQVDISQTDALTVGATIEDLDIADIQALISHTKNSDLLNLYEKLMCGSRNHLRAFVNQLNDAYSPQYISQVEYNSILAGSHESCGNQ